MNALELLRLCERDASHRQLHVQQFVDDFRAASPPDRTGMVAEDPAQSGRIAGLVAAVASALGRETGTPPPEWLERIHSPEPFFAFPARGFELRLRLLLESPPPFRIRNVFVPENHLRRA